MTTTFVKMEVQDRLFNVIAFGHNVRLVTEQVNYKASQI